MILKKIRINFKGDFKMKEIIYWINKRLIGRLCGENSKKYNFEEELIRIEQRNKYEYFVTR